MQIQVDRVLVTKKDLCLVAKEPALLLSVVILVGSFSYCLPIFPYNLQGFRIKKVIFLLAMHK